MYVINPIISRAIKAVNLVILFNICIYTNPLKSVQKSGDLEFNVIHGSFQHSASHFQSRHPIFLHSAVSF